MPATPPSSSPALTASVVLHLSDLSHVTATLRSLEIAATPLALPYRVPVMVVDQSLDADYADRVARQLDTETFAAIAPQLLVHAQNRGYGAGHNRALEVLREQAYAGSGEDARGQATDEQAAGVPSDAASDAETVRGRPLKPTHLILNPDVELAADALEVGLAALAADAGAVLAAPLSMTATGEREYLAKAYPSIRALTLRAFAPKWLRRFFDRELARYELRHLDAATEPAEITLASGACMLVRRQALDVVGGFDESFFLYFEDYDLSLRLARWGRLLQVPGMRIVHHGGGAARKGLRHIRWFAAGGLRFFRRWGWRCW